MDKKNYTIRDIAKMTGLSRGTIDKVIHKRPGVSQKNIDRVNEIIKEVDYQPNLLARSLKKRMQFTIAVIIPEYKDDAYWAKCYSGIKKAESEFNEYGGKLDYFIYKRSPDSYVDAFNRVVDSGATAALIAPINFKGSTQLYDRLKAKNIPFSFVNSRIEETNYRSFIGQDYYQSGKTAARLMELIAEKKGNILIINEAEELEGISHLKRKEEGFRDYFSKLGRQITTLANSSDSNALLRSYQELNSVGIFITTSHTSQVIKVLKPDSKVKIIGYDLIKENAELLKKKDIDVLIYQNPEQQGFEGINHLTELLMNQRQPAKEIYLPIEIVISENVENYL